VSVATTLITLSLERRHLARRATIAEARSRADAQPFSPTAEPPGEWDDIISSH
jgi:hypothetical protein